MDQRKLLFQWQVPRIFLSEGAVAAKGAHASAVSPCPSALTASGRIRAWPGRGCCGTDGRTDGWTRGRPVPADGAGAPRISVQPRVPAATSSKRGHQAGNSSQPGLAGAGRNPVGTRASLHPEHRWLLCPEAAIPAWCGWPCCVPVSPHACLCVAPCPSDGRMCVGSITGMGVDPCSSSPSSWCPCTGHQWAELR